MEQRNRDETRWLARLLAVIFILLGVRAMVVLARRMPSFSLSLPSSQLFLSFFGLAASMFFFWFSYRLFKCSSLWDVSPWLAKEFPLHDYFKCQYFRINKHVRRGLISGLILLIIATPLPLMFYLYEGVWFWEFIKPLFYIIIWPLMKIIETLNLPSGSLGKGGFFILLCANIFAIGFAIGISISYMMGRIINNPDIQNLPLEDCQD
jgi:hypothetical protein